MVKGILIPVGGNEDKGDENGQEYPGDFVSDGILWHVLNAAKGVDSKVVVIPTASSIPEEVALNYDDAFRQLGCEHITILDARSPEDANSAETCRILAEADCVMMTGGDQSKISTVFGDSLAHQLLLDRYQNDPIVIAGTSAGAMVMSQEMIAGGSSTESFLKDAVIMKTGLGLLPLTIIDSHFIRRGRFGRLAEAVAIHTNLLGIGLAEDTGIVIREGNLATVIGSGMVVLFDARSLSHNNHDKLKPGTPMSMSGLVTHILSNGDQFTISDRKLRILPLTESFI